MPSMPTKKPLPKVQITLVLHDLLETLGFEAEEFSRYFASWKALGPGGENADYYFGKDGYYNKPLRGGKLVVRHVHLPPEGGTDLAIWDQAAERRTRKTSDTALIYAHDHHHGFLLIDIVIEPNGHLIATMATPESIEMMNLYADVAEAFIHNGTVLI
jgi:mRNA interferase YafO